MTSSSQLPPGPPAIPPEPVPDPPPANGPHFGSIILGLIVLGIGLWYFADRTLGLAMPRIDADQLWPIAVIGIGAWLIIRPRR